MMYGSEPKPHLDATRLLAGIQDAALDSSCDAIGFEELRTLLAVELALTARRRNAMLSLQSRIPDELWCLVWQDLPLVDRLSITRVCHTWRAIAHSAPRVWTLIDVVVDIHNLECDCQQCVEDNRTSRMGGRRAPNKTNIQFVEHAVQLGQQAPIVLQVTDDSRFSNDDAYRLLGEILAPHHAYRICAVYLNMVDNEIVAILFDSIEPFPALRVLHLLCGDEPPCENQLASSPLNAPLLEELVMSTSISWDSAIPSDTTFVKLHTLRCPVWSCQNVLRILRVCPVLQRVRFDISPMGMSGPLASAELDEARRLAGRIPDVTLRGLKENLSSHADYLDIFNISEIKSLSLWYFHSSSPSLRAVQNLASHCATAAGNSTVALACAEVDYYTAFKIEVDGGLSKHRLIMQSSERDAVQQTWKVLLGAEIAITELIIDFNLWPRLLLNVKPMTQVTIFAVLLWKYDDVTAFLASNSETLRLDLFPGLHGVTSREETATLEARAKDFTSVIDPRKVRRDGQPYLGFPSIEEVHGGRAVIPGDSKRVSLVLSGATSSGSEPTPGPRTVHALATVPGTA